MYNTTYLYIFNFSFSLLLFDAYRASLIIILYLDQFSLPVAVVLLNRNLSLLELRCLFE